MWKQQGLSLVELMISITIGLILMTGVVQLFISSKTTFATQQGLSRIQETGRLAIEFMAQDVRMAGYMGCATRGTTTLENGLEANADYLYNFTQGLVGYVAGSTPLTEDVLPNTDILVVRHAGNNAMPIIEDTNHGGTVNANIDVDGPPRNSDCVGDLCTGDTGVISDCTQGRIFRVTGLQGIGSGDVRVVHSSGGVKPSNKDTKLGGQQFGAGAEVLKVSTVAYFLAESATSGEPGLWQRIDNESYELLEGVEDMSLRYGIGGMYYATGAVPDWNAVDSVRVSLLVRSVEDNVVPESQPYTFDGQTVTPADRRMRQVFTSTIAVRNRLQ